MKSRIGVFSGTFDPVHQGHIAFCLAAQRICKLDEIVLLPERLPREKQNVTDFSQRLALLQDAVRAQPALRVMDLDSEQFTVRDTLPELRHKLGDVELTLLVGSDVVRTFLFRWEGLKSLLSSASVAIGLRQGDTPEEMMDIMRQLEDEYAMPIRYTLVESPHAAVSSSQIRKSTLRTDVA